MIMAVVVVAALAVPGGAARSTEPVTWQDLGDQLGQLDASLADAQAATMPAGNHWRWRQCTFQSLNDPIWTALEERLTGKCVVDRFGFPGGFAKLSQIISCESGWSRLAYNPAGFVGLAQHAISAWAGRVRAYAPAWWKVSPRWTNSRTMLAVTVRYADAVGLGPWSCA